MPLSKQLATLILLACLFTMVPAMAQTASLEKAMQLFSAGQYQQALILFQKELLVHPQNMQAHYYAGVCLHCLGQINDATREYTWIIASSENPDLVKRSQAALENLSKIKSQQTAPPNSTIAATATAAATPTTPAPNNAPASTATSSSNDRAAATTAVRQTSLGEVVDVYTSWCHWCKILEPIFNDAASKYSDRLSFNRHDAEKSKTGKMLARKYRVRGFPTLLFFNNEGVLIKRVEGAPQSMEDMEDVLFLAYPPLKPVASVSE